MSYFALHPAIFESSLFRDGIRPTLVFLWLLAHCDEEGTVIARPWAITRDLAVSDSTMFTEAPPPTSVLGPRQIRALGNVPSIAVFVFAVRRPPSAVRQTG